MTSELRERIAKELRLHEADVLADHVARREAEDRAADRTRRTDRILALLDESEPVAWVTVLWSEDGESFFPKARIFATRNEAEAHKREMDADGGRHGITIEAVTRRARADQERDDD